MKETRGVTLVELVVVVAIVGVLMSIGIVMIPRGRFAVNQATEIVAGQVTRARFEALRHNKSAGLYFDSSGEGSYLVYVDDDGAASYTAGDTVIMEMPFGVNEMSGVQLDVVQCSAAEAAVSAIAFEFDSRGVHQYETAADISIALSTTSADYTKYVRLSPQGRAEITSDCS